MRRLLILTLPAVLMIPACDSDDGDDRNANIKALSGDAAAGMNLFTDIGCAIDTCHGADGDSGTTTAPRLTDVADMRNDDEIINSVLDGRGSMPPQDLDDQQMADVLAWIRTTF